MSKTETFIIPSNYGCLAILDPTTYKTYLNSFFTLEELKAHFLEEMNQGNMIAWGCEYGNWRLEVYKHPSGSTGYQEAIGNIYTNGLLLLVTYDCLFNVALDQQEKLPSRELENLKIHLDPGQYQCRVVQLFDPLKAESRKVFNQKTPHYNTPDDFKRL